MITNPINNNKDMAVHNNNIFKDTILEDWRLTNNGIETEDGFLLNPSSLRLLQWKSGFYDRGRRIKYKW